MPRRAQFHPLPLPRGWPRRVRSAVIQVISLARTSLTLTHGWASESLNHELRQQAEEDRLGQEVQLLREEIRIKDARMERIQSRFFLNDSKALMGTPPALRARRRS